MVLRFRLLSRMYQGPEKKVDYRDAFRLALSPGDMLWHRPFVDPMPRMQRRRGIF